MIYIPGDIVEEILVRLPEYGSVVRFSAVCSQWQSITSNPVFKKRHQHEVKKQGLPFSIMFRDLGVSARLHVHESSGQCDLFKNDLGPLKVKSSSADLLLVEVGRIDRLCVVNSTTRESFFLPSPPPLPASCVPVSEISHSAGLVCAGDGNFTVVRFTLRNRRVLVRVFRSSSGQWDNEPLRYQGLTGALTLDKDSPVGLAGKGIIYWPIIGSRGYVQGIASFIPHISRLSFISIPQCPYRTPPFMNIGIVRGKLRLWHLVQHGEPCQLTVWERANRDWVTVHDIRLNSEVCPVPGGKEMFPVALHPEDGDVIFVAVANSWEVRRYNMRTRQSSHIFSYQTCHNWRTMSVFAFAHPPHPTKLPPFLSADAP